MGGKLSYTLTIILVIVSCSITYLVEEYIHYRISKATDITIKAVTANDAFVISDFRVERLKGYSFTRPLVTIEPKYESPTFNNLKLKINHYIEELKKSGILISASFYLRYYGHGKWMSINPDETYYPGSMIKVANLLTYLRMSEIYPGILDKKLLFTPPKKPIPAQSFNSKQIQPGQIYTVRELLKYMIAYSDNNATYLLNKNADSKTYHKLFNDLKIPLPKSVNNNFLMTAQDFSVLFKVLYNSSYLSFENSEFALSLLNQCDFKEGMVKELPPQRVVVHKFGEMADEQSHQLHETGLVYMDSAPYLLTIMTKGYKVEELAPVLSHISKMVYDEVDLIPK